MRDSHSGGCQCGAVRFKVTGKPERASVCYCRMCQKASASYALALVGVRDCAVEWTRGAPAWFQSSNQARRGFCRDCGTPLAYEAPDGLALTVMAFDKPENFPPKIAWGAEGKPDFADAIPGLPEHHTMEDAETSEWLNDIVNYQHPDHDTEEWPPKGDHGDRKE